MEKGIRSAEGDERETGHCVRYSGIRHWTRQEREINHIQLIRRT